LDWARTFQAVTLTAGAISAGTSHFRPIKDFNAMEKTVSSLDAPQRFGDLLQEVSANGDRYVVEKDGVPLAAMVPFALYARWKRWREGFFAQMREAGDRAGLSETEAARLIDEAKRAVRSQP